MAKELIETLLVQIEGNSARLRQELSKSGVDVTKFAAKTEADLGRVDSRFSKLGSTVKTGLAALGVSLTVTAFAAFAKSAIDTADAIGEAARAAGIGAERFQKLRVIFGQNGIDAESFDGAMRKLNQGLGQFILTGAGPASNAIKQLGLSQDITSGKIQTAEQLFDALKVKFQGIGSSAEAAALGAALFGREAGAKIAPVLRESGAALSQLEHSIGGVFSDEQVAKADKMNDALARIANTVGTTLKGAFVDATNAVLHFFKVRETLTNDELDKETSALATKIKVLESGGTLRGAARSDLPALRDQLAGLRAEGASRKPPGAAGSTELGGTDEQAKEAAAFAKLLREVTLPTAARKISSPDDLKISGLDKFNFDAAQASALLDEIQVKAKKLNEGEGPFDSARRAGAKTFPFAEIAENIKRVGEESEKAKKRAQDFADSFASAFESRGIQALIDGDIRGALQGLAKDLIELIIRLTVLKPLAEKIAEALNGIGKGKGGAAGGALGLLGFAGGGNPPVGVPSLVGERGPELFIPDVAGRILNTAQSRMALAGGGGGGVTLHVHQAIEAGIPPQWDAALAMAGKAAAFAARDAISAQLSGRR